jgi:hypothetical protein
VLLFAAGRSTLAAQGHDGSKHQGSGQELPTVEDHMKVLTEKLALNGSQQAKIKPIMQTLHDATLKFMHDEKLSHEERLDRVMPLRLNADKKIREVLSDDQKQKLDQYEQGPHPEMHGDLH